MMDIIIRSPLPAVEARYIAVLVGNDWLMEIGVEHHEKTAVQCFARCSRKAVFVCCASPTPNVHA